MHNHEFYIRPSITPSNITIHHDKPLQKTNIGPVPKAYHRNVKRDMLNATVIIATCLFGLNCILFFATVL